MGLMVKSGLTIFHRKGQRRPVEFGFQSLDSDLLRIYGNVLKEKEKKMFKKLAPFHGKSKVGSFVKSTGKRC